MPALVAAQAPPPAVMSDTGIRMLGTAYLRLYASPPDGDASIGLPVAQGQGTAIGRPGCLTVQPALQPCLAHSKKLAFWGRLGLGLRMPTEATECTTDMSRGVNSSTGPHHQVYKAGQPILSSGATRSDWWP